MQGAVHATHSTSTQPACSHQFVPAAMQGLVGVVIHSGLDLALLGLGILVAGSCYRLLLRQHCSNPSAFGPCCEFLSVV